MTETVLVTGISGFIAKHVALELLQKKYRVIGTVRSDTAAAQVQATLSSHGADLANLTIINRDLTSDRGWPEAMVGVDYVQHLASPVPLEQPKDREALVPDALDGTLRVLKAAVDTDIKRIVMTSSMAAMIYRPNRSKSYRFSEGDWTDPEWSGVGAYAVSKTRAELAAWEFMGLMSDSKKLTVCNPGLVLGPLLDDQPGTSIKVLEAVLTGAYPAVPPVTFPIVDVRDVAKIHVKAMTSKSAAGRRLICAGDSLSMKGVAKILRDRFPDRKGEIPTREIPGFLIRMGGMINADMKALAPDVGTQLYAEREYVEKMMRMKFRAPEDAVISAAQSLIDFEVV